MNLYNRIVDTYGANYPNDLLDDDIKKLTGEDFLRVANIQKGELDILDGSIKYHVVRSVLQVKRKRLG